MNIFDLNLTFIMIKISVSGCETNKYNAIELQIQHWGVTYPTSTTLFEIQATNKQLAKVLHFSQ